jgi:hypothetical protein
MTRGIGFPALFALFACSVILTIPGCGGKPPTREQAIERYSQALREGVSSNVADERRRAQMLSIVDQLEAVHVRFNQETADFIANYRKLNADYDASRPAFDQLFSDFSAKRVKARSQALDLHFQLASLATVAEWDSIGRAETKLYEKVNAARPAKDSAK